MNPRACSLADVSQYCGVPSSLISTAVISGSSPELVAVCPYSPSIRPLETLHNELSLRQFIDFIVRLTRNHRSSVSSALASTNPQPSRAASSSQLDQPKARESAQTADGKQHSTQPMHIAPEQQQQLRPSTSLLDSSQRNSSNDAPPQQPVQRPKEFSHNSLGGARQVGTSSDCLQASTSGAPSSAGLLAAKELGGMILSPGNSLSNSLIWSGPPSSFASSSAGPSSPSAALELWTNLELDDEASPSAKTSAPPPPTSPNV